jgi:monoamine oxidase
MAQTENLSLDDASELMNLRLSRRQLLQASGVLLGAASIDRRLPTLPVGASDSERVLVVGGGIAGLLATYRLRQAGIVVDLVEARDRVGGRLQSISNLPGLSGTVELGGEFIDSQHTAVRSLAAELGLETADLHLADRGLETELLYFRGQRYSHRAIATAFTPLATRIAQDLRRIAGTTNSPDLAPHSIRPYYRDVVTYRNAGQATQALDQLSLAEYLQGDDVDPVVADLIKAAYVTEYGTDAEEQTCLNMLLLIGREANQWSTYGESDERWHIIGGNEQLTRRLAQQVAPAITTGMVLESLRKTAGDRYQVSFRSGAASQERIYDRVLLTVPFSVLRQVDIVADLPPLKQKAIAELGYGTSSKLVTHYQSRIWRDRYQSTMLIYTDQDFQNTWESARYTPGSGGWVTNLRGGKQGLELSAGAPEERATALAWDLDKIFPGIAEIPHTKTLRAIWASEPYIQGSYACYRPGQWTSFGGIEAERVDNLWFAGEHCALNSQGYINGACETAELAVLEILQDMGLRDAAMQQGQRVQRITAT